MSKSKKLVFFGTEDFSAPSLEALLDSGWQVVAVVTKPDSPSGRGRKIVVPKVKAIAEKHGIKVLQPAKVTEINEIISSLAPDLGVLVAYGKIIPQSTLDLFPGGIVNVHPSLLPKYRGPAPIEAAILNGDSETGVSLIRLVAEMDAGPIYAQQRLKLTGAETKPDLYVRLSQIGAELLLENLSAIYEGYLTPKPQVEAEATYTKLIKKSDGRMDFGLPAEVLEQQVRAYAGWPRSAAEIHGHQVIVTRARVAKDAADGEIVIKCSPGRLAIEELVAPSGKKVSAAEFIRGYKR